jgi:fatty acid desaturase
VDNSVSTRAPDDAPSFVPFDARKAISDVAVYSRIDNARGAWAIARQWIVIGAAGWGAIALHHWAAYVIAGVVIASRQHALAIIMHDQAHCRLFTHRRLAEWVCDLFCAFPVGLSTSRYRRQHLAHHRFNGTPEDPDLQAMNADPSYWRWPKSRRACLRIFAFDMLGLNLVRLLLILRGWTPATEAFKIRGSELSIEERVRFAIYLAILVSLLTVTHGWATYGLLWLLPSVTVLGAIFRMRAISEHVGLPNEHELNATRHIEGAWWERLLIAPLHVNHHLEHHLFPSVPHYNLSKLRRRLLEEPRFRAESNLTRTYTGLRDGVIGELLT